LALKAAVYKTYETPDVVFVAVGKAAFTKSKNALKLKGTFLTVV